MVTMSRITLRHLFFPPARRVDRPRRGPGLRVEALETRANPVSAVLDSSGVLNIDGSSSVNDRILVQQSGGFIRVLDARFSTPILVPIQTGFGSVAQISVGLVSGIDVNGLDGNDLIDLNSAAAGFDSITIDATLRGGSGNDSIAGGDGNDLIASGDGNDWIFGNEGDDSIDGGTGNDIIVGGSGDDTLVGGSENDRLFGSGGSDSLLGLGGNDSLFGELGDDTLLGGSDNDRISGSSGNDSVLGEGGDDVLFGDAGNDTITAADGDDRVFGLDGNDSLSGDAGNDTLDGGNGNDSVAAGADDDSVLGGTGNDSLDGGIGTDTLVGGAGNDLFYGGEVYPGNSSAITATLSGGTLFVTGTTGNDRIGVSKSLGTISVTDSRTGLPVRVLIANGSGPLVESVSAAAVAQIVVNADAG